MRVSKRESYNPMQNTVFCQYGVWMPWELWRPPSTVAMRLRVITLAMRGPRRHSDAWTILVVRYPVRLRMRRPFLFGVRISIVR